MLNKRLYAGANDSLLLFIWKGNLESDYLRKRHFTSRRMTETIRLTFSTRNERVKKIQFFSD